MRQLFTVVLVFAISSLGSAALANNSAKAKNVVFGHGMLEHFMFEKGYLCMNHGSFGSTPIEVYEAYKGYERMIEGCPDCWYRYREEPTVLSVLPEVAKMVNADPEDIVFIENASDGISSIVKSLKFNQGEKVLRLNIAYSMIDAMVDFMRDQYGMTEVIVDLQPEDLQSSEKILAKLTQVVKSNPPIRIAVIDHICSLPALVLPIKEISAMMKANNVTMIVDGAHAMGSIPLNVTDLGVDFYISNFYKWFFVPKAAAFMYVSKQHQVNLHPNIISFNYGKGFQEEFIQTGTRNYATYLAVRDAMKFRASLGEEAIRKYNHDLAWDGANLVADILGTYSLIQDKEMHVGMVNIYVPLKDITKFHLVQDRLWLSYNTIVPFFNYAGKTWTRISGQIFNEISDYEFLGRAILAIVNDINSQTAQE